MKVGTDGTLLGAWASSPVDAPKVLDVGTGTGLIALMMAQRFPESSVTGIDIDGDAVDEARENVSASPFCGRVSIMCADVLAWEPEEQYDVIVSNPPYFTDALTCPDSRRTVARHASSLPYGALMSAVCRLLAPEGRFSVVCPFDCLSRMEEAAALAGLFKTRQCAVRTTPRKEPRRYLLELRRLPSALLVEEGVIETAPGIRSDWYQELTKNFYIR